MAECKTSDNWNDRREALIAAERSMNPKQYDAFLQMTNWFGMPPTKPTHEVLTSRNIWELWEMFRGRNEILTTFLQTDIFKTGDWILRLFPHESSNGAKEGLWTEFVFDSQVMDTTTAFQPNTLLKHTAHTQGYYLNDYGTSFRFAEESLFSPDGSRLFVEQCRQLERCAENTLGMVVLRAIYDAGLDVFVRNLIARAYDKAQFARLIDRIYGEIWAGYQKSPRGADKIEAMAYGTLVAQHVTPTDSISPPGCLRWHLFNDTSRTEHRIGGDDIYKKEIDTDRKRLFSRHYDVELHESRPYKLPQYWGIKDPFTRVTVVGEKYVAYDWWTGHSPAGSYRSKDRAIIIGHEDSDFKTLQFVDLVENSCVFNSEGNLTDAGKRIVKYCVDWDEKRQTHQRDADTTRELSAQLDAARIGVDGGDDNAPGAPTLAAALKAAGYDKVIEEQWFTARADGAAEAERKARLKSLTDQIGGSGDDFKGTFGVEITRDHLRALSSFNIPIPFGAIAWRNAIVLEGGAYVQFRKGESSGKVLTTAEMAELVRNGAQRILGVNLNFSAQCVIIAKKNFCFLPNVYISNYRQGFGTNWFQAEDSNASANTVRDGFVTLVPSRFKLVSPYADLTGFLNAEMVQLTEDQRYDFGYPTAELYRTIWGANIGEATNVLSYEHFSRPDCFGHTFCFQGWQRLCGPDQCGYTTIENTIFGKGPLGRVFTPETLEALRGGDATLYGARYGDLAKRP